MFKKYSILPKRFKLVLKINETKLEIKFLEPTIYILNCFQELIELGEYEEALKILNIDIDREVFYISPDKILYGIFNLLIGEKQENKEEVFEPAFYEKISKLYNLDYLSFVKNYTITQLNTLLVGLDYNSNIENKKQNENIKYKLFIKEDVSKYEDIYNLDKVQNYKFTI